MYRVTTQYRDQKGKVRVEHGPWHGSRAEAEAWAERLHSLGYQVSIESLAGGVSGVGGGMDSDLANALSSMA